MIKWIEKTIPWKKYFRRSLCWEQNRQIIPGGCTHNVEVDSSDWRWAVSDLNRQEILQTWMVEQKQNGRYLAGAHLIGKGRSICRFRHSFTCKYNNRLNDEMNFTSVSRSGMDMFMPRGCGKYLAGKPHCRSDSERRLTITFFYIFRSIPYIYIYNQINKRKTQLNEEVKYRFSAMLWYRFSRALILERNP